MGGPEAQRGDSCTFLAAAAERRGGDGGVNLLGLMQSAYLPVHQEKAT